MPFFSVIIPVYNRIETIQRAIGSVLSQNHTDFELIVIDDGSCDGTRRVLATYGRKIRIISQEHRGVSAARNEGVRNAHGEWILFLDSDDAFLPGKMRAHCEFIKQNPSLLLHQTDEMWIRNGRRVNPRQKHKKREGDIFIPSLQLCLISPSSACIHRSVFEKYGMFDEKLPACEDYDLWLRVCWKEHIGLIPQIFTVKYGGHPDQLSRRYWGMDRFRVYSICKLLTSVGNELCDKKKEAAIATAKEKCCILREGARKRGNTAFVEQLNQLIEWLDRDTNSNRDFSFLLQE
ncbi:MAG: glycosyltransferase [Spirochaetes bacterium]|nr:glycosyltransferase [Spirochaetota bacterium]